MGTRIVKRDYEVFSGHALEGYFREVFIDQGLLGV